MKGGERMEAIALAKEITCLLEERRKKEVRGDMTLDEIISMMDNDKPEDVLASIPPDKMRDIPSEICKLLTKNGLSFQQAELLLAVAKSRLRKAKI